jgi:Ala-tRNA(Pro) deacylase
LTVSRLPSTSDDIAYNRLIALLDEHRATYRLIDHPPEGRTEVVSVLRGNATAHAAKCMVVMVKVGKKVTRYVLAVVPGDARVDLAAIKQLLDGTYASFASPAIAEDLAHSPIGTVLPFPLNDRLELIADPDILEPAEIFFNAARLDRSIALATSDYRRIARPRLEAIAIRGS